MLDPVGQTFLIDAQTVVAAVRAALADVLAIAGIDAAQPQELSRQFGLDKTLAWRISRAIREPDPCECIVHLPRGPGFRIFNRAMARQGVPEEPLAALSAAVDQLEAFTQEHAGNRDTLEAMLSPRNGRSAPKKLEAARKAAYLAYSAIWGVQARLQLGMWMLAPARGTAGPDRLQSANASGVVDFRRLRPDVYWTVTTLSNHDAHGKLQTAPAPMTPMDVSAPAGSLPVLREFCSDPLPALRLRSVVQTHTRVELAEGPIGITGSATVLLGRLLGDDVAAREQVPGEHGEHLLLVNTPVESAVLDLYVHRELGFAMNVEPAVYNRMTGGPMYPEDGPVAPRLPVPVKVAQLGGGDGRVPDTGLAELPRYGEIVALAARRLGFGPADFRGFRLRVNFPPLPITLLLRHPLLPAQAPRPRA